MNDIIFRQRGKDGYYKIWHTPEKSIFIFVESGEGSIVLRDESYPIAEGVLCFIGENKYHYTFPSDPDGYVRSKLTVDTELLNKIAELTGDGAELKTLFCGENACYSVLKGAEYERVKGIFERINGISDSDSFLRAEKVSSVMQLMIILAENVTSGREALPDALSLAVQYINKHISEDISISDVSKACYVSKYHLCRMFKSRIGITIMDYVLQTRITVAKELLSTGKTSVTEVSGLCGFSSPAYFSRAFKAAEGISPLKYKRKHVDV